MRTFCLVLCVLTFIGGIAEVVMSTSSEKEIVAILTILISVLFFVGAAIIDALDRARNDIVAHLKKQ